MDTEEIIIENNVQQIEMIESIIPIAIQMKKGFSNMVVTRWPLMLWTIFSSGVSDQL